MDRIVLVTKPTRLEELVQSRTEGAVKFDLESRGESIAPYKDEDAAYKAALAEIRSQIPNDLPIASVNRKDLPNFLFRDNDLIIVCGPDGLFANVAKYVGGQQVLTVNPGTFGAGKLMLFSPSVVGGVLAEVKAGKQRLESLPFVRATIDDERTVWGINDIFIGRKDKVSAWYGVSFEGIYEHQASDGILVSTGIGSTGWMNSIRNMVSGLTGPGVYNKLSRTPRSNENELVFVVINPISAPNMQTSLITGRIVPGKPLEVISGMPTGGYIFSDGVTEKTVKWEAGSKVVVTVGERYVQRIVPQ